MKQINTWNFDTFPSKIKEIVQESVEKCPINLKQISAKEFWKGYTGKDPIYVGNKKANDFTATQFGAGYIDLHYYIYDEEGNGLAIGYTKYNIEKYFTFGPK